MFRIDLSLDMKGEKQIYVRNGPELHTSLTSYPEIR